MASGLTVIMGAQRFGASAGLLAEVSDAHRHALSAVKWASGDVHTTPFTCSPSDPDDDDMPPLPPPWTMWPPAAPPSPQRTCDLLFWMLVALAIAVFTTMVLHLIVHNSWKRRVNRKWYQYHSAAPMSAWLSPMGDADHDPFRAAPHLQERHVRFIPYPSAFVFPGLQLVVISLFLTGLVQQALFILSSANGTFCLTSSCPCYVLAYIAVAIAIAYILLAVALLSLLNRSYRGKTWRPTIPVGKASMVDDPLFRALSNLRARMRWHDPVLMRIRGTFVRPEAETAEPARTERLLRRPYALGRANASDSLDAYGFSLMFRARGTTSGAASFEVSILTAQIAVGALNGLGAGLRPAAGSTGAMAQMLAVLAVQALASLWVSCTRPTADRCIAMVIGTQFALEGTQTALLLIYTFLMPRPALEAASFAVALSALCTPIALLAYDATIFQVAACLREGCSWKSVCSAALNVAWYLPRMVLLLLGIQVDYGADAVAEHAGDDMQKIAERSREDSTITKGPDPEHSSDEPEWVHHSMMTTTTTTMTMTMTTATTTATTTTKIKMPSSEDAAGSGPTWADDDCDSSTRTRLASSRLPALLPSSHTQSASRSEDVAAAAPASQDDEASSVAPCAIHTEVDISPDQQDEEQGAAEQRGRGTCWQMSSDSAAGARPGFHWLESTTSQEEAADLGAGVRWRDPASETRWRI